MVLCRAPRRLLPGPLPCCHGGTYHGTGTSPSQSGAPPWRHSILVQQRRTATRAHTDTRTRTQGDGTLRPMVQACISASWHSTLKACPTHPHCVRAALAPRQTRRHTHMLEDRRVERVVRLALIAHGCQGGEHASRLSCVLCCGEIYCKRHCGVAALSRSFDAQEAVTGPSKRLYPQSPSLPALLR